MDTSNLVVIGPACNDLPPYASNADHEKGSTLGGAVFNCSVVSATLGIRTNAVTLAPQTHPRWEDLQKAGKERGFGATNLNVSSGPNSTGIATFVNLFDNSARHQFQPSAPQIMQREQLSYIDDLFGPKTHILIGSVSQNEMTLDALMALSEKGPIHMTIQGFFREVDPLSKRVHEMPFPELPLVASCADTLFLSTEDVRFYRGDEVLRDLTNHCPRVVFTKGRDGVTIFENGEVFEVPSFPLDPDEERGLNGAGETFATAMLVQIMKGVDPIRAAAEGHIYTAQKIANPENGFNGIPSLSDVSAWRKVNRARIKQYTQRLKLSSDFFIDPGNVSKAA